MPTFHALATTAMERLTPELIAAGFVRTARRATAETWTHGETVRLVISAAAGNEPESPETIVGEYAVLLTRTVDFEDGRSVRISNVAAQLALYWQAHVASRAATTESEWVEEMIELVMRRGEIVDDVRSAPAELRLIVAGAAKAFVASDSCRWILRRALSDARHTPAFVETARDRFLQLAALA